MIKNIERSLKMRVDRLLRLLRMEGSVGERIGTGCVIVGGFIVGLWLGRFLLTVL
jgi:hypothetical protein